MKKYFLVVLITISVFLTETAFAEVSNSGFIPGQIWYSKDTLVEGETVNIHTAVWNGEKETLAVKIEFYDKNVILGSRDVALASSELKDVSVPWKITAGDHVISAKIISSTATISGKKEKVVLDNVATENDKQFVSVVTKNSQGEPQGGAEALIDKTSSEINNIVPEKVSSSVSSSFQVVDDFRDKTFTQVSEVKSETQKEISLIKEAEKEKTVAQTLDEKQNIEDATKKPITYVKLFLFTALAFIFGNKIIFYGLSILIAFYILRVIYRKIKGR